MEQDFYGETVVHFLAAPTGGRDVLVDVDALFVVVLQQLMPVG